MCEKCDALRPSLDKFFEATLKWIHEHHDALAWKADKLTAARDMRAALGNLLDACDVLGARVTDERSEHDDTIDAAVDVALATYFVVCLRAWERLMPRLMEKMRTKTS
jgi:hypothetical protein